MFDRSIVRQMARDLAGKPYKAPDKSCPTAWRIWTTTITARSASCPSMHAGTAKSCRSKLQFFHRGFFYTSRVDIYEVANGKAMQDPLSAGRFLLWRHAAAEARHRSRLCRFSPSRTDQPARLLRRGLRLPRRQLFPRRRQGRGLRALGAGTFDQYRRAEGRGVSRRSRRSGSRSRRPRPPRSWCMRCWTAKARRRPTVSRSGRATPPCSMSRWRSIRGSMLDHAGLAPMTSMFFFGPTTATTSTTSAPRSTIPTGWRSSTAAARNYGARCSNPQRPSDQFFRRPQSARLRPDAA